MVGSNSKGAVGASYNPGDNPHKGMAADPPRQLDIEIESLKAEIERLNRELDDVWSDLSTQRQDNASFGDAFKMMREEINQLRAVLKPFAKAADCFDGWLIQNPEDFFAFTGLQTATTQSGAITVGDLRRARAALEPRHD